MADKGWIKLHRSMLRWEWYDDIPTKIVFLHLLLMASFAGGGYKGYDLKPGQCIIGRKALAKRLRLSERQVRTALEHLKSTNEITIETTNRFSIVTVENWTKFQELSTGSDQQNGQQEVHQSTNNRPATDQQPTTLKECKECKERNNDYLNNARAREGMDKESESVDNIYPWSRVDHPTGAESQAHLNQHQAFIEENRREKNAWGRMSVEERRAAIKKRSDEVLAEIERGIW